MMTTRPTTNLDTLLAALDAKLADLRAMIAEAREPATPAKSEPGGYWIGPFKWRGGPCPLPADSRWEFRNHADSTTYGGSGDFPSIWPTSGIFFYSAPDPLGWLDFDPAVWTPPAELFDDDCPVRLEWAADAGHEFVTGFNRLEGWGGVHYVRLVAREVGNG